MTSRHRSVRRRTRAALVLSVAALVVGPVPGGGTEASGDTTVSDDAVWRALRRDWRDGWGTGEGQTAHSAGTFGDVEFPSVDIGFAAIPRYGDGTSRDIVPPTILRTDDGGETWAVVHRGTTIDALAFLDPAVGVAVNERIVSQPAILRTEDGGATWDAASVPDRPSGLYAVSFARQAPGDDPHEAVAVAVGAQGAIFRSTNGGRDWYRLGRPDENPLLAQAVPAARPSLRGLAFIDASRAVAVGDNGVVLRTSDGGATWVRADVPPTLEDGQGDQDPNQVGTDEDLRDVAFVSEANQSLGVLVGDMGTILRSTDGGTTWTADVTHPLQPVHDPSLFGAQRAGARVNLDGVALADADPANPGGLAGYVVGSALTVLEMQGQAGTQWATAMVDARSLFQGDPAKYPSIGLAQGQHLTAVAITARRDATGTVEETALAVGEWGAILKRTPASGFAGAASSDDWWRCLPAEQFSGPGSGLEDVVESVTPGDDDQTLVCPEGTAPVPKAGEGAGPTLATGCEVEGEGEAAEFPCRATWLPRDEFGESWTSNAFTSALFLDDFGPEGRRVVLARRSQEGTTRLFLFDPDSLTQRGVSGFGGGFRGPSGAAALTGVLNLDHAPAPLPRNIDPRVAAYDTRRHRLFLATTTSCTGGGCVGVSPRVIVVSLIGDFTPTITEVPVVGTSGRANVTLTHLAFDPVHEMLYAVTEADPYQDQVFPFPQQAFTTGQVTLHAFYSGDDPATPVDEAARGVPVEAWVPPRSLEDHCHTVFAMPYLGVNHDGDALALACQAYSFPHFGAPAFESHKVLTIALNLEGGKHPRQLVPTNPSDVTLHVEPIGGRALNEGNVTFGIDAREVLAWRQPTGANLWDFEHRGWIGTVPFDGIVDGAGDPTTGRLYLRCAGCINNEGNWANGLLVVDTLNLPVDKVSREVVVKPNLPLDGPVVFVPGGEPQARGLLFAAAQFSAPITIYEDRIPSALARERPDPDVDTHDVAEADASSVTRLGRATAYGTRLWWTGLSTALPGSCRGDLNACGEPILTYDWLFDPTAFVLSEAGPHFSAFPSPPAEGSRELRAASIERASLENDNAAAKARGIFYDGAPGESGGNTGNDLRRRRGATDAHDYADAEVRFVTNGGDWEGTEGLFCGPAGDNEEECRARHEELRSRHDEFDRQFGPYQVAFDEGVDRAMRELDGRRSAEGACGSQERTDDPETSWNEEDCLYQFDQHDPRDDPETEEDERAGLEHQLEVTSPSECLDPGRREAPQLRGSAVSCDRQGGQTGARAALGELSLAPASGGGATVRFSVGSASSDVRIHRHPDKGTVVEATAAASDVELGLEGIGSIRIGEIRTTARARAKGRPGTASSWVDVAYEDVVARGPGGEERFACGRSDPKDVTGTAADPRFGADRDGDGEADPDRAPVACDPRVVVDVINRLFTDRVRATTSSPDTDPEVMGSDGGAQAIVRRDPAAVISDAVINRIPDLLEMPGLQLTIFNDGLRPNRVQIDLAAVYAEAKYFIGKPRAAGPAKPTSLGRVQVELTDPLGAPLASGSFALLSDHDGDGKVGPGDVALKECTTGPSGSCSLDRLDRGAYLVEQRQAPPGFVRQDAAVVVSVSGSSTQSVEFVNAPDHGTVEVELTDPEGRPLAGGAFVLVRDGDGDQAVGPTERAVGTCTTAASGTCRFEGVPLGGWVLHQSVAPQGFEVADDVAFALVRPGQVARVTVVNGVDVAAAGVEVIEIVSALPSASSHDAGGSWIARLPRAVADILLRDPIQALLVGLTVLLFGAPAYLMIRRRELGLAKEAS